MKRILCLINTLEAGGAQRQLVGLAGFLKKHGYDVLLAHYQQPSFYAPDLDKKGVPYIFLEKAQNKRKRIWYIMKFIREYKPDVVIAYLDSPTICTSVAKLFNRRFKLIVSERNTTLQTNFRDRIKFELFRIADFVVPNSFSQANYINSNFPFLSDKVVTIPNFVDIDFFVPPVERKRSEILEIIIAARIAPQKNTIGFIDTVAALKERGHKFHMTWYGLTDSPTDYETLCKKKIEQCGVADVFTFKEKTPAIKDCYQQADYFCLPSFYEGTPNAMCEAMACGLPVLCSNVCDNPFYVVNNENGFLFDPHNTDSIVEAFEKMFSINDDVYLSFSKKSRSVVQQKLSTDAFFKSYTKLVEH